MSLALCVRIDFAISRSAALRVAPLRLTSCAAARRAALPRFWAYVWMSCIGVIVAWENTGTKARKHGGAKGKEMRRDEEDSGRSVANSHLTESLPRSVRPFVPSCLRAF